MTEPVFVEQMKRLKTRFGDKAFDPEITRLIAIEMRDVPDFNFKQLVDNFLGSRKHHDPPVVVDFRDGRLAFEKLRFHNDTVGAVRTLSHNGGDVLKGYLKSCGAESLSEAVQKAKGKSNA